jgi:hypothetical protein
MDVAVAMVPRSHRYLATRNQSAARDDEAVAKTEVVEQRVAELESLLRSSLGRDPYIRFDSLKISAALPLSISDRWRTRSHDAAWASGIHSTDRMQRQG